MYAQAQSARQDAMLQSSAQLGSAIGREANQVGLPPVLGAFEELLRAIHVLDDVAQAVNERTNLIQRPAAPEPAVTGKTDQIRGASSAMVVNVEDLTARVHRITALLQGTLQRLEV